MTPVQRILEFIGTKELSPLADYIRKEILPLEEKMLEDCWDAAAERTLNLLTRTFRPEYFPDKETYINSIIQQLGK